MAFPIRLLLLAACMLLEANFTSSREGALSDHQCHRATRAACVWVSSDDGHQGKAHVGRTCKGADVDCQYDTTCRVTGVSRDIYLCKGKGKQDTGNVVQQQRVKFQKHKHVINAEHQCRPAHVRLRRAVTSGEQNNSQVAGSAEHDSPEVEQNTHQEPDQAAGLVPDQPKQIQHKLPVLFEKIMARHRSNNMYAFNRGTYFLNGYSFVQSHKGAVVVKIQDAVQKPVPLKKSDNPGRADAN